MNRKQRLRAAIAGGAPDRVPVSAWGHFYRHETSATALAAIMVEFFERFDWDYLKVHARASYHVEGWGFTYEPSVDAGRLHVCTAHPIDSPAAWRKLAPLSLDSAPLAEQFDALRQIRRKVGDGVPIIMTVFSPLDVAEKLVDRNARLLKEHIEADPDSLAMGLAAIADTFERFVARLVGEGVDGIFFSTKWANNVKLSPAQYERLVRPYDLQVLAAAKPLWCNMLHLCEDQIQLSAMADYPVQVFHWDSHAGHNPGYGSGQREVGKAVGGGVDAATLARGSPADVIAKARAAIGETKGTNFLLGPGCSVQIAQTSADNLHALRRASEAF
jgi:uroporphyrinogen decarboxylase